MQRYTSATHYSHHDKTLWHGLILVAFFGMLRVSEYASPSTSWCDAYTHLSPDDISFSVGGDVALLNLKVSNTDPFRKGFVATSSKRGSYVSSASIMKSYVLAYF